MAANLANDEAIASLLQSEEHRTNPTSSINLIGSRRITPSYRNPGLVGGASSSGFLHLNHHHPPSSILSSQRPSQQRSPQHDVIMIEDDDDDDTDNKKDDDEDDHIIKLCRRINPRRTDQETSSSSSTTSRPLFSRFTLNNDENNQDSRNNNATNKPDPNIDSDEMLARQLQEKFDYELAQRLSKEDRPSSSGRRRNIPSLLDLPDMQPDTIPSSDRGVNEVIDASRQSSSSSSSSASSLFSSRIPASFETDILYQMARRNPEQRANNNNNINNNNNPTMQSLATRRAARVIDEFEVASFDDETDRPQLSTSSRADRRATANDNNDTNDARLLVNPTQRSGNANSRGIEPFFLPHPILSARSNTRPTTRPTALNTDPINNLASAFSILNNDELISGFMDDARRDDDTRLGSVIRRGDATRGSSGRGSRGPAAAPSGGGFESASTLIFSSRQQQQQQQQPRSNNSSHLNDQPFSSYRSNHNHNHHYHHRQSNPRLLSHRGRAYLFGDGGGGASVNPSLAFRFMNARDFTPDDYETLLRLDEINGVKKTLTKSEINSLPCFDFKRSSSSDALGNNNNNEQQTTCSICYEDYALNDRLKALTCTHNFHKKCIDTWLQESRRCPLCQKDAVTGE